MSNYVLTHSPKTLESYTRNEKKQQSYAKISIDKLDFLKSTCCKIHHLLTEVK